VIRGGKKHLVVTHRIARLYRRIAHRRIVHRHGKRVVVITYTYAPIKICVTKLR
jgi:hypothetical protein